jgi:hypothetical protein
MPENPDFVNWVKRHTLWGKSNVLKKTKFLVKNCLDKKNIICFLADSCKNKTKINMAKFFLVYIKYST